MIYPRKTTINGKEVLVDDSCLVTPREHLGSKRIINVLGSVHMELDSTNLMLAMDSQSHDPIKLIISSPGGEMDAAFLIYDILKLVESPIITLGTFCCSAAVMILAAGTKGMRYLLPHSKIMLHLPSSRFEGDTHDIEIAKKEMIGYRDKMIELYRECGVNKTRKQILLDIDREFWMNPKEAIDYGLCDAILTKEEMQAWLK